MRAAKVEGPEASAEILLAHAMRVPRSTLYAHLEDLLPLETWRKFVALVEKRRRRLPLPYLIGKWEFMGVEFTVRPRVLIPRSETETLVEALLDELHERRREGLFIADIGTGCGTIALSLALYLGAKVVGTDISPFAIELAKENARKLGVEDKVEFLLGDLYEPLRERGWFKAFDAICGNLPYIPTSDIERLQPEVGRYEPRVALDGGPEGLDFLARVAHETPQFLKEGGFAAWEIGAKQWPRVRNFFFSSPGVKRVSLRRDLAGRPRVVLCFY